MAKKGKKRSSIKSKKTIKFIAFILIIITVIASVTAFLYWVPKWLFTENNRFVIKHIVVTSKGWWNKRPVKVAKILNITIDKTNLFTLSLPKLRKKLEKQPTIKSVTMQTVLPDTLMIDITERIPRARLSGAKQYYLDANAILMEKKFFPKIYRKVLPVIINTKTIQKEQLKAGEQLPLLLPPLELIMEITKKYPNLTVRGIIPVNMTSMIVILDFDRGTSRVRYQIETPTKDIPFYTAKIKSVLEKAYRERNSYRYFTLMFNGKVTWKTEPFMTR